MTGFIQEFPGRIQKAVHRAAVAGKEWIVRGTPFHLGAAKDSWEVQDYGDGATLIASLTGAGARYTPFLESGTFMYGPFHVAPKTMGIDKRVKGGMPGAHMVENNIPAIEARLEEEMQKEFDKVKGT